ncbi:MAG: hypothetical protein KJ072_11610 [Verrucomicrobia bacterium]|nr:hypothetical protein [Verrucomicrobiota bacterium]
MISTFLPACTRAQGQEPHDPPPIVTILTSDGTATEPNPELDVMPDTAEMRVERTGDLERPLNVYYLVRGTATNGKDYRLLPGEITIPAGESAARLTIDPLNDDEKESLETVVVNIIPLEIAPGGEFSPGYYLVEPPDTARAVIQDDETQSNLAPKTAIVSPPNGAILPLPGKLQVLAEARDPDGWVRAVEFFVDGQSIGVVHRVPWSLESLNPQEALDDPAWCPPHLFAIHWTQPTPGRHELVAVAEDNLGLKTKSDPVEVKLLELPEPTVVHVLASDPEAAEGPLDDTLAAIPDPARFTLVRSGPVNFPLEVFFELEGTAVNGLDYRELPTRITIPEGAESVELLVEPIDDPTPEPTESVILRLVRPACIEIFPPPRECYLVGTPAVARAWIRDNDPAENLPPRVRMIRPHHGQVLPSPADLMLTAVAWDSDGTVISVEFFANDRSLGVVTEPDPILAPTEHREGDDPSRLLPRYSLPWTGVPAGRYLLTAQATDDHGATSVSAPVRLVVIDASPPQVVTVEATDPRATEGGLLTVIDPAVFTVQRRGDLTQPLLVSYLLGGTAENGSDYQSLPGTVEFPADTATATIEILPLMDNLVEGVETVIVRLQESPCPAIFPPPPGCYLIGEPGWALAGIADGPGHNLLPKVEIVRPFPGATYHAPAEIPVATQARDPDGYVTLVEWFANDLKIGEQSLQFIVAPPPGQRQLFEFTWRDVPPGHYLLTARATDDQGQVSPPSEAVPVTVLETHAAPVVTLFVLDPIASERPHPDGQPNTATFKLRRSGALDQPLTVFFEVRGTARNGVDYVALPQSITIPAGTRWTRLIISPLPDDLVEDPETVVVELTASPAMGPLEPYRVGAPRLAAALILDAGDLTVPPRRVRNWLHLQWPSEAGAAYRLEVSENLRDWQAVTDGWADETGVHHLELSPEAFPRRFYRLRPLSPEIMPGPVAGEREW